MPDLRDLYQEVILDHNRRPRNFGRLAGANRSAEGFNALCGDRLTLYLKLVDPLLIRHGVEPAHAARKAVLSALDAGLSWRPPMT